MKLAILILLLSSLLSLVSDTYAQTYTAKTLDPAPGNGLFTLLSI